MSHGFWKESVTFIRLAFCLMESFTPMVEVLMSRLHKSSCTGSTLAIPDLALRSVQVYHLPAASYVEGSSAEQATARIAHNSSSLKYTFENTGVKTPTKKRLYQYDWRQSLDSSHNSSDRGLAPHPPVFRSSRTRSRMLFRWLINAPANRRKIRMKYWR